jgi:hypothetical protein
MMDLSTQTVELLKNAIYAGVFVFAAMVLVHNVSRLVHWLFGDE